MREKLGCGFKSCGVVYLTTVVVVPVMYSEMDIRELVGLVPSDFAEESEKFWSYVREKLGLISNRVSIVCLFWMEERVDYRARGVLDLLKGARVLRLDDVGLLSEVRGWFHMGFCEEGTGWRELYEESNRELSGVLCSLLTGVVGSGVVVALVDPAFKPVFREEFRVIRMVPFEPEDYVRRCLVQSRIGVG
ncbi:MAG: hypothetical protein QXI32_02900 [Candidatus Bathyarchaeia archaeon]